ncbi:raffinose/stachyose/melibiose transport system substrate-binding protein [Naumannella cuiyingiana]|uniref:Raffinose/stachyose/melibiose transport system substrate-binding protein n=1 Tax=Naumannella cuiyingiana TaxID=1347891 RepID=A0A7Z0IMJ7_9ACTN|nr:extracellular solute-binding protein [Naumannella cuiyingiana]NYI72693.1 raffinose/stachyose/melibiose transport system substrate-binding protein [Naumannella cuiyingiana]
MKHRLPRAALIVASGATLLLSACVPGASGPSAPQEGGPAITAPVTVEEVAALGETTLDVLADSGEEGTLAALEPLYEERYPNVDVRITVKGFDDLMKTVVNVVSSEGAPDVVQGNQGYAVDGALVEAGLIRNLDDVAAAYGWEEQFGAATLEQFRWTEGGAAFGEGALYGVSPVDEFVGVFYNRSELEKLGITTPPKTFEEFQQALAAAKAAGKVPLMLGNSSKYPANQVFSVVQSAFQAPDATRAWITGSGENYANPANLETASIMRQWVEQGYVVEGYDGISPDDAVAKFSAGEGVFLIGGSWNANALAEVGGGDGFGFVAPPVGAGGERTGPGSLGLGWHINAGTQKLPAAVAFVAMLNDPSFAQQLADLNRIPVAADGVTAPNQLFADAMTAAGEIRAGGGATFFVDWATPTMADTAGSRLQELLAGRITPQEYVNAVQADWTDFQEQRATGR